MVDGLNLRIPDLVRSKFSTTHADALKALESKISQSTPIQKSIKEWSLSSSGGSNSTTASGHRTHARPDFDGVPLINWRRMLTLAAISVPDFDAGNTYLALNFVIHSFQVSSFQVFVIHMKHIFMGDQIHAQYIIKCLGC